MSRVSVRLCGKYEREQVYFSIKRSIDDIGGIRHFIKKGQNVLLKVNLLMDKAPEKAVTTHPVVVESMIDIVREAGGIPIVGDSPFQLINFKKLVKKTGMEDLCRRKKVKLIELKKPVLMKYPKGKLIKKFNLTSSYDDVDVIIDMPKLKTHTLMIFTGAIKNLFGLIPGGGKTKLHLHLSRDEYFAQMLLDLYSFTKKKVRLVVMDGIVGMEGQGPNAGDPRELGLVIAGDDALALDTVVTEFLKMRKHVPYLRIAEKKGIPEADLRKISIKGEPIEKLYIDDFIYPKKPHDIAIFPYLRNQFVKYPKVKPQMCVGCEHCCHGCPNKAIKMVGGKPQFDYSRCIRCYCCQEVCPKGAIYLKETLLSKTFSMFGSIFHFLFRRQDRT